MTVPPELVAANWEAYLYWFLLMALLWTLSEIFNFSTQRETV